MRRRGRFLVLEGLDGAGTTTQSRLLAERMRRGGRRVHLTAEPSGGPVGALVRQVLGRRIAGPPGRGFDPEALALLFAADRLDHFRCDVEPHLAEGSDVVSDRYTLSSLAYQSLTTGDAGWVEAVNSRAPAPGHRGADPEEDGQVRRRRFAESGSRELYEVPAFQRRVSRSYERCLGLLRRRGEPVAVVDGEGPVDEVAAAVRAAALGSP